MDAKTGTNTKTGTLTVGDKSWSFPIYGGTIGPDVIDIGKLYAQSGMFTFDPGFTSTGACESKITYIDGDEGVLLYRGVPIEQIAEHGDFLETCYLLLYGRQGVLGPFLAEQGWVIIRVSARHLRDTRLGALHGAKSNGRRSRPTRDTNTAVTSCAILRVVAWPRRVCVRS